jgi:6-pyruvoyl-tetrahydropterin synthase
MKKIDKIIEEFDKKFLNASAMPPTYEEIQAFLRQTLTDYKEETLKLITEEIAQAQIEGTPTSRLTSLYNKIK